MNLTRRYSERQFRRFGTITLLVLVLSMVASFNLSKFPGFRGTTYTAEFTDASGIHEGNLVQVGGMRVGRVQDVSLDGAKVVVKFEVDNDVEFGKESRASIEVFNMLGEKYLELSPAGEGQLDEDDVIPVERTESAYDIVEVFGDLTTTTEDINKDALKDAFNVLADTANSAAPEIKSSFDGLARLSQTIASRDAQLQELFRSSTSVSRLLADRSADIVELMGSADLVFQEVQRRKNAIHRLLVNARIMAIELRGLARDNQKQIGPALQEVDDLLDTLISKEKELKATLAALGPYASILGNIIGTGPWFDAYAINILGHFTGEFVPGGVNE
jgi:phospholipid/cholesterol/gamma-HCH transport system substrate-binding protein